MPKGVARPFEERIADKQRKKDTYQQKIEQWKLAISKLERVERRLRSAQHAD